MHRRQQYVYSKYTTFEVKELYRTGLKTKLSGTSVTLSWNKASNATGYQVYYFTTSGTSGFKKLSNATGTSYTAKNLKKGTTYYFKVRAYRKDANGNYQYGAFTGVKKVKVKQNAIRGGRDFVFCPFFFSRTKKIKPKAKNLI